MVLSYDVINKTSLAIKRKYKDAPAEEGEQVYKRLCDRVVEYNAKQPSKRYQNTLALTFIPRESELIQ